MMGIMENKCDLDKLPLGTHYSVVGCVFNVNESTIQYIQKKEETIYQSVCQATPRNAKVTSIICDQL